MRGQGVYGTRGDRSEDKVEGELGWVKWGGDSSQLQGKKQGAGQAMGREKTAKP